MAQWGFLKDELSGVDTSVRLTWQELAEIVGQLPQSASRHRAWWSGDRTHVREWSSAGFTIANLQLGREVTFVRSSGGRVNAAEIGTVDAGARISVPSGEYVGSGDRSELLLVTCAKTKLAAPAAARDLYVSTLFKRQRAYAESRRIPWFILSAEHGLVSPGEWLAPYERYLPDTPVTYRAAWGDWVAERLDMLAGPLQGVVVEIHAGAAYIDAIAQRLTDKGAVVVNPLVGLALGERLEWYTRQSLDSSGPYAGPERSQMHTATSWLVEMLIDESRAIALPDFLGTRGEGFRRPGLYSWWVNKAGAADLTEGLGVRIPHGLIYVGLAGATRWPSGKRSTSTLWSRITTMHLGGNHEFSTLRRSLGSILAHEAKSPTIDEAALSAWMNQHLRILATPYEDVDVLGGLEADVLRTIDPPLNLRGMKPSPARARLTELRRTHTANRSETRTGTQIVREVTQTVE